ncbi:uncharacterized protein KY384_002297 [Bacidia gigantensis]|uniref:uncharacterized protein n=1 Tax=Bacidia gigantensis TaxID=2732470 RepID=UPI001D043D5F|nr:uncharacterized protein KY384_002297 [Bacidia gigantensis]KAG8533511.1 hypothetical protein KY384_002297 [Bacidia gigantensis]
MECNIRPCKTTSRGSDGSHAGSETVSSSDNGDYSSDIRDTLREALSSIGPGTFATSGPLPQAVNPGLVVEGIGKIGLPLSDRDAVDIIRISHKTPLDEGNKTTTNDGFQRSWALESSQVQLNNPKWSQTIQELASLAAQQLDLGSSANLRHEFYRMHLDGPGDHADSHR